MSNDLQFLRKALRLGYVAERGGENQYFRLRLTIHRRGFA